MCDNSKTDYSSTIKEQRASRTVKLQTEVITNTQKSKPKVGLKDMKMYVPSKTVTSNSILTKISKHEVDSNDSDSSQEPDAESTNVKKRAKLNSEYSSSGDSENQHSPSNLNTATRSGRWNVSSSNATFNAKIRKPNKTSDANHFTKKDRPRADEVEKISRILLSSK